MDPVVIITIIFIMLALITTLVTLYIESRKHIRRLEGRIERLSSRIQAMSMKELDTVLKSVQYKKERDELCDILDEINQTVEAIEDGRRIKLLPRVMTYDWEDGKTKYTSYYTYNPSHDTPSQTGSNADSNTAPQDSSIYSGGGGIWD